jgi:hypothetical protein
MKTECVLFTENSQYAIVADIFAKAANVDSKKLSAGDTLSKNEFYDFIEKTPYTSMMVHLVDAMKDLGYKIVEI